MESGACLTLPFWSLSTPVSWEGEDKACSILLTPMFGTFNSHVKLNDAILRRIIHDVIRQAEAGATTNKLAEFYEFIENPSHGKIFKERALQLPMDPEIQVIYMEDTQNSAGNTIKIKNKHISVHEGTKYDKVIKYH